MSFVASPDFWSVLASVATVFGFAVVIWASIIAVRQLKESTRTRHLEAMLQVYQMIGNEDARSSRRLVYNLDAEPGQLTAEQRDCVEKVTVSFDRIGFLVKSGLVPKDHFFESHCEVVIRSWRKLEPYIDHHIQKVGGRHAHHFRFLAQEAEKYHAAHFPEGLRTVDIWKQPKEPA